MDKEEARRELRREIERFRESPDYAQITIATTRMGEIELIGTVPLEALRVLCRQPPTKE